MRAASPLRYPGGKWRITPFLERLISINAFTGYEYIEPYAGGASLALSLLLKGMVSRIHLNDLDSAIYSFWWAVLNETDYLLRFINDTPLDLAEWHRQRAIYSRGGEVGSLALGCATFYLNRTSHSGIMNGGVIGGKKQQGVWRIDARFNRKELQRRIEVIADSSSRICIYQQDALEFLRLQSFEDNSLVYLDPPYFRSGKSLYLNAYGLADHQAIYAFVQGFPCPWMISYDDVPEVRSLYRGIASRRISLLHSARTTHLGREVMFFREDVKIPNVTRLFGGRRKVK
jgi:DNA adenine methylase